MDMNKDKDKQSDELLNRIRNELTAIMAENATNDPERKISYERFMKPTPLPTLEPSKNSKKSKTSQKSAIFHRPQSYRQAVGGKSITMKPSHDRLLAGRNESQHSLGGLTSSAETSSTSLRSSHLSSLERSLDVEFMEAPNSKIMDEDLQKMQSELAQSYELFQGIGERFESINFSSLKARIRDLQLNNKTNGLGRVPTEHIKKLFEASYLNKSMDKLTSNVGDSFRSHPGEFGDIPELSNFFQACAQLEHGLDTLKQQRTKSNELEKRLCWATEIAYDRMEEIRNSIGDRPETNF